jgi:hypothetical protein
MEDNSKTDEENLKKRADMFIKHAIKAKYSVIITNDF